MTIIRDKNVCFGQPILNGRRLTVFNIVSGLYYAYNFEIYLKEYGIKLSDAKEAVKYCKMTKCSVFKDNYDKYCDGCILRTISEGERLDINSFNELESPDKISISHDRNLIFFGSLEELEDSEFGLVGWLMAEKIIKREKWDDILESE